MTLSQFKIAAASALLIAAVALPIWQETRIRQITSERNSLQQQTQTIPALRQQIRQLQQAPPETTELDQLRRHEQELKEEVAALRSQVGSGTRAKLEAGQLRAQLADQQGAVLAGNVLTNAMASGMKTAQAFAEQRARDKLAHMKASLHLTPDQETAIHDVMMQRLNRSMELGMKLFTGKLSNEQAQKLREDSRDPDQEILALLTPDQQAAYPEFKKELAAAEAQRNAQTETDLMQKTLGLSNDQASRVLETISKLREEPPAPGAAPTAIPQHGNYSELIESQIQQMEDKLQRRIESLRPILTAEQLERYRDLEESKLDMTRNTIPLIKAMSKPSPSNPKP